MDEKALTVKELIELLQSLEDQNLIIRLESGIAVSDCVGLSVEPGFTNNPSYILLIRTY
jgi:hypothetical protein